MSQPVIAMKIGLKGKAGEVYAKEPIEKNGRLVVARLVLVASVVFFICLLLFNK